MWEGFSYRTYVRTGKRPAAMTFVPSKKDIVPSSPTLTEEARLPAEVGRIEFKAFDCLPDVNYYQPLSYLLMGIALDETLSGRSNTPDTSLHQTAGREGFNNPDIRNGAKKVMEAASNALPPQYQKELNILFDELDSPNNSALLMKNLYRKNGDVLKTLRSLS